MRGEDRCEQKACATTDGDNDEKCFDT